MADRCDQWRNQTNSHAFFDFEACHCDGEDLSGNHARMECYGSALTLAVPLFVLLIFVLCRCPRGCAQAIGLSLIAILVVVPLTTIRVLARLGKDPLMRLEAFAQMILDVLAIRTQRLRRPQPMAPISIQTPLLPPELCDLIIALCDHRRTLLSCSLVCSAWVPMSRQHLAITLAIMSHYRARRLGNLLRSPFQTFSHSVHLITFGGEDFGQHWRVLRLLRLKGAKLDNAIILRYPRPVHHLLQYYPDLLELTFRVAPDPRHINVHDDCADQLQLFLSKALRFKRLRSLSIDILLVDVPLIWSCRLGAAPVTDVLPITRLALYGTWCAYLVTWLQSRCRCLQRLELAVDGGWLERDNAAVDALIRANWQSLRHLTLAVRAGDAPLNLSSAKHLESLHLILRNTSNPGLVCAVETLQMLNAFQPLGEVLIRIDTGRRREHDVFPEGYPTAFSNVLVNKLGMELADTQASYARYVQSAAAFAQTSIKTE
ncbi:hypothetical protein BDZ89DRAFT_722855 [Hymenopellis radicata]|nr:hypothetical protein BDZ89DRAFT_722855 [Hymenopellis radicata]